MSKKSHREAIDHTLRDALLQGPIIPPSQTMLGRMSLGPYLDLLKEKWAEALVAAQKTLDANPLTAVLARDMARQKNLRGTPRIVLDANGDAFLEFTYKSRGRHVAKAASKWASALPSLDALRKEAADRGIDISDLGRSKREIIDRLGLAGPQAAPTPEKIKPEKI